MSSLRAAPVVLVRRSDLCRLLTWQDSHSSAPVKATTAGVLIDVSVLDSKGQPVLDLSPADFELNEDGKRQQLVSVTLVNGGVADAADSVHSRCDPGTR